MEKHISELKTNAYHQKENCSNITFESEVKCKITRANKRDRKSYADCQRVLGQQSGSLAIFQISVTFQWSKQDQKLGKALELT